MRSQLPWIVSLAALCAVLAGCNHTEAPLPPIPGHLAFVSNRGRTGLQYDIFAMGADGSNPVNLTPGDPPTAVNASFSPDAKRILFTGPDGGDFDIFSMNADG